MCGCSPKPAGGEPKKPLLRCTAALGDSISHIQEGDACGLIAYRGISHRCCDGFLLSP